MDNPYKAPLTTLIDDDVTINSLTSFKRFSTWAVFGLTIITLSFYIVYWMFSRTKILNNLKSVEPIGDLFINTSVALFFLSFFIVIGESYMENNVTYLIFSQVLSVISSIFLIVWAFKFRNRLNVFLLNNVPSGSSLGPFLTFFFQFFYLSYKLNENIEIIESNV